MCIYNEQQKNNNNQEVTIMKKLFSIAAAMIMVMSMSVTAFAAGMTREKALDKALSNAKLKESQVKYVDVEFDREDNEYSVEFTKKKSGNEYEYEINATTGTIKSKSVDIKYKWTSSRKKVSKAKARKKVAKHSGISYNTVKEGSCKYEYDDGEGKYEIKFATVTHRYEYEIQAATGKVIGYEWDLINK